MSKIKLIGEAARHSSRPLAMTPGSVRNDALYSVGEKILGNLDLILEANSKDVEAAGKNGLPESSIDRLLLTEDRLKSIVSDVNNVISLQDPLGVMFDMKNMPNGLQIGKKRVPLGVIGVIYESRPNVTVDISILCIKSGNAAILRGGSESFNSNLALGSVIRDGLEVCGINKDAVQVIQDRDRALVSEMLQMSDYIDLMIPRGGSELVNMVNREAKMPAINGGVGVCHTYVDRSASLEMALDIVYNAKVQRPSVCNALDTVLVNAKIAKEYLPSIADRFAAAGVEMRCDSRTISILGPRENVKIIPASDLDWDTEHLSLVAGVRIVDSIEEAICHIENHGTGHSEAIVTEDYSSANQFVDSIDASAVMVNASTRFNDGGEFGLGAEVAISTNKMHARGPMGLTELTSYKWIVFGNGQVRD
jgi:glutamate-5-semialdehyde dehydrogenase